MLTSRFSSLCRSGPTLRLNPDHGQGRSGIDARRRAGIRFIQKLLARASLETSAISTEMSGEERSEFVSLVSPDELVLRIRACQPKADETGEDDFGQAMDKVFDHHAPLLGKLAR